MRLLIVDGSNLVMRSALGGEIAPEPAVTTATGLILRAASTYLATHLVVALDSPTGQPSWRRTVYPDYKANRTRDTTPWLRAAAEAWLRRGWWVEEANGYEADDLIATLALRVKVRAAVVVVSGDSDLLPLTAEEIGVAKPVNGGKFEFVSPEAVCEKYGLRSPQLLVDLKALTGETGDNVPGVPGIGPVRAKELLTAYANLDGVLAAGAAAKCKYSTLVAQHAATVALARQLVTLDRQAPVLPIQPKDCVFRSEALI